MKYIIINKAFLYRKKEIITIKTDEDINRIL